MKPYIVTLQLTVNPDYPAGSDRCGYRMTLYLGDDYRVDEAHFRANPEHYRVIRFWEDESECGGKLTLHSKNRWYFELNDGTKEPLYHLSDERLLPGEFVDVRDHASDMHIFKVTSVELINTQHMTDVLKEPAPTTYRYYDVHLSIAPSDYESFLHTSYTLHLALTNTGYVDVDAWHCKSYPWPASSGDIEGTTRFGEVVYSSYAWYLVFRHPRKLFELMWKLDTHCFLSDDLDTTLVGIRDRSGHWHQYAIDSVVECAPVQNPAKDNSMANKEHSH